MSAADSVDEPFRIGVLASIGKTLDAFFPEMARHWTEAGHFVRFAAGTPTQHFDSDVIDGLTQSPRPSNLRSLRSLRQWANDHRLEFILTNTATASALVRLRPVDATVVYFCHGLHWNDNSRGDLIWKAAESFLLRRTSSTIVSNREDEAWMASRLGSERVTRLDFGVGLPLERFPRKPAPSTGERPSHIAWIGDFSPRKRPELAVAFADELRRRGVDFRMTMAGDGPRFDATARMVASRGLQQIVGLPGRVDSAELIAEADLFVHTSKWEGLPRVLLETAAVGRNAYAFDVKGVRDAPAVALARDGDVAALADLVAEDLEGGLVPQRFPERELLAVGQQADLVLGHLGRDRARRQMAGTRP